MSNWLSLLLIVCFGLLFIITLWFYKSRKYDSSSSVANAYDQWTSDRLLELLWGEHIHLGFYDPNKKRKKDFREAKIEFVHQLVNWSELNQLPKGSLLLDVGCGIGGSSRILARDYGFNVLGITISPQQAKRATELTPDGISCRFVVMDALDLELEANSFDAVWSVEAGPHMPDKQRFADEMLRVLRPGGILALADWNKRDQIELPMNNLEKLVMRQLLHQWAHPDFASIKSFHKNLLATESSISFVETDDWTRFTVVSWIDSIFEGIRRPGVFLKLGPLAFFKGLREIPTVLLMRWAFIKGLMQFGVFKLKK